MEAKPEGSPRRVGHGIASPKGAAKKEVHTSRPQVAGRHSNTVNREAPPTRSSHIRSSEPQWSRTQGQLSKKLPLVPDGRKIRWQTMSIPGHHLPAIDQPNTNQPSTVVLLWTGMSVSVCVCDVGLLCCVRSCQTDSRQTPRKNWHLKSYLEPCFHTLHPPIAP